MKDPKAYPLPTVIDPGSARCLRVYVPNDSLYIGAFWQAYTHFAQWTAWQRDDAGSAAAAAAVWREWVDLSRELFDAESGCGLMDVRQSEDACILEKTFDGETWEQWANLSLCNDELIDLPPLYPEPPGDGRREDEAETDDVIVILVLIITQIDEWLDEGIDTGDVIVLAGDLFRQIGLLDIIGIAGLVEDMAAHTSGERQDAIDNFAWETMRNAIVCKGSLDDYINHHRHWLDDLATAISDWLNDAGNWLADALNKVADALTPETLQQAAEAAQQSGAGFGWDTNEDCPEWEHIFDFVGGSEGWVRYDMHAAGSYNWIPPVNGVIRPGEWRGTYSYFLEYPQSFALVLGIKREFAETTITYIHADMFMEKIPTPPSTASALSIYQYNSPTDLDLLTSTGTVPGLYGAVSLTWGDPDGVLMTGIAIDSGHGGRFAPGYEGGQEAIYPNRLLRVVVRGTGTNPFS